MTNPGSEFLNMWMELLGAFSTTWTRSKRPSNRPCQRRSPMGLLGRLLWLARKLVNHQGFESHNQSDPPIELTDAIPVSSGVSKRTDHSKEVLGVSASNLPFSVLPSRPSLRNQKQGFPSQPQLVDALARLLNQTIMYPGVQAGHHQKKK